MTNPYRGLPDERFWRRSMARMELFAVDPVGPPSFVIGPGDRVATAGSCFAQHISRSLMASGLDYWVVEAAPEGLGDEEARKRNFGVFSCRYGNIYTVRQLRQLLLEATGRRNPDHGAEWRREDGRVVDPLRPLVEPAGFATQAEMLEARARHLAHVRRMFEELDIFVFTLGLTETWRSRREGTVYPLAPGVAGGSYDPGEHEFVNVSVAEVEEDLRAFLADLRAINPASRVILTVSPVPLIATFEPRHVLVSTTYSKSVLRVAVQSIVDSHERVDYFPSYEMITGQHAQGRFYGDDLRDISREGVFLAMQAFLRHYTTVGVGSVAVADASEGTAGATGAPTPPPRPIALVRSSEEDEVVCDMESIEEIRPGRGGL